MRRSACINISSLLLASCSSFEEGKQTPVDLVPSVSAVLPAEFGDEPPALEAEIQPEARPLVEASQDENFFGVAPLALNQFVENCGGAGLTVAGERALQRSPYLQQLTASSTDILYKVTSEVDEGPVSVSKPDGSLVARVFAEKDPASSDGLQRVARIGGLEAATDYCYSVGTLTERIGFRTAPRDGADALVRFVAFGDSGNGSATQVAVRDQLMGTFFDLLLHTGDIAYETGSLALLDQHFFQVYRGLLRSIPVFPVPGNHEYYTNRAQPFLEVFDLPDNGVSGRAERWYSFNWGDVHFVGLDTEQLGSAQTDWLDRDLAQNHRGWVIVYMHRPPFSSGVHGGASDVEAAFVPVLEAHGVPLVLTGHDHNYERTVPIHGVTYVITGGGGKSLRAVGSSWFTAYSESVMHFVSVEIRGRVLELRAVDSVGREFDAVQITR